MTGFKLYGWRGERNAVFLWDPKHERPGTLLLYSEGLQIISGLTKASDPFSSAAVRPLS